MYINRQTGKIYNGGSITIIKSSNLFSGIPTNEQLEAWGYEEYIPPVEEYEESTDENEITAEEALDIIVNG